jgi:hypothetical protein
MDQLRWSDAEKKIARRVFEKALQQELDELIHKVKEMARDIKEPTDLWKLEGYLTRRRKAIDSTYDYRYSQLPLVFGQLARKGQIRLEDLQGLGLDYHLKTGHTLSVQNRPTEVAEDVIVVPCGSVRLQGLGLSPRSGVCYGGFALPGSRLAE